MAWFMGCIEVLKRENNNAINMILKRLDKYCRANLVDKNQIPWQQLHWDDNLVVDFLPLGIVNELRESTRVMVTIELKEKCFHAYISCRKEFLNGILLQFLLSMLFMERRLYECIFERFASSDFSFMEVCKELATNLLGTSYALTTWSHFIPSTLQELMQEIKSLFLESIVNH